MSPDVSNPAYRAVTYRDLYAAYKEQVEALVDGGVDIILFETTFDTLNAKAGLEAAEVVLKEKGIKAFDLICVNLYDFESALAKGLKPREAIEEIDIGGPCMLRAASKNFHSILVLSDPDTYAEATAELKANDMSVSLPFRQRMAARTFAKTSRYDAMIAEYLTKN